MPIQSRAIYMTTRGPSVVERKAPAPVKAYHAHNLDELSVAEVKAFVNAGEISAEEVYAHESAAEHPRKSLLHAFAPKADEAAE